jgi:hypothetical protein
LVPLPALPLGAAFASPFAAFDKPVIPGCAARPTRDLPPC